LWLRLSVGLVVAHIATRTTACPSRPPNVSAAQAIRRPAVTVIGPARWVNHTAQRVQNVLADFNPPGSDPARLLSYPYMRIGISNLHPKTTMKAEATRSLAILHSPGYTDVKIVHQRLCGFLGVDAADFEYTGVNGAGVPRHGIERHWMRDGTTRILEYATPADQWSGASLKFFYGLADNTNDH
jgi:hypothetical protein